MNDFADSYLGRLRAVVGSQPLLCPCVRLLIEDDQGRILMQARGDYLGFWGLPGGNIECGESAVQAAEREAYEETALRVTGLAMFGHSSQPDLETMTLPNGHVCHYHASLFHTRHYSGTPQADGHEGLELRWFAPDGPLPLVHPQILASVQAFCRYRDSGKFQLL